eukprot:1383_1
MSYGLELLKKIRSKQELNNQRLNCKFYGSMKGCRYDTTCQYSHSNPNSVHYVNIIIIVALGIFRHANFSAETKNRHLHSKCAEKYGYYGDSKLCSLCKCAVCDVCCVVIKRSLQENILEYQCGQCFASSLYHDLYSICLLIYKLIFPDSDMEMNIINIITRYSFDPLIKCGNEIKSCCNKIDLSFYGIKTLSVNNSNCIIIKTIARKLIFCFDCCELKKTTQYNYEYKHSGKKVIGRYGHHSWQFDGGYTGD